MNGNVVLSIDAMLLDQIFDTSDVGYWTYDGQRRPVCKWLSNRYIYLMLTSLCVVNQYFSAKSLSSTEGVFRSKFNIRKWHRAGMPLQVIRVTNLNGKLFSPNSPFFRSFTLLQQQWMISFFLSVPEPMSQTKFWIT